MIEPWAREIVDRLQSYTEISPSGRGVHILIKGRVPPGGNKKGKVEMYSQARYFTMTGHHLKGAPLSIEDRQAQLTVLHTAIFGKPKAPPKDTGPGLSTLDLSDQDLIDLAHRAANGAKFGRLWRGVISEYPSQNEADLALCGLLAFWTGRIIGTHSGCLWFNF